MPEFLYLSQPIDALQSFFEALPDKEPVPEEIDTSESLGRILFEDVHAPHPLPEFPRSTVDGFAVKAQDTFGTSDSMPGYLHLVGEVLMGTAPHFSINAGDCALIHTGGVIPDGADAVIMLENTQLIKQEHEQKGKMGSKPLPSGLSNNSEVEIGHAIAVGENVIRVGEDVAAGQVVLKKGKQIRPAEIGGCMALGIVKVRVAKKPLIGILSTGDEVISPYLQPLPGQVRDVNSDTLSALVKKAGGFPEFFGIITDNLEAIKLAANKALKGCDALIISAGSSASVRDMTAEVINSLGTPGVLVHGVNVKPGKPTILAVCDGKAVVGLPGNPVSALVVAGIFLIPLIDKLLGKEIIRPHPFILAKMTVNVPSQAGREDWIAVRLHPFSQSTSSKGEGGWQAEPIFGKSNLIFSLAAADGLVRIPPVETGISAGDIVEVLLLD